MTLEEYIEERRKRVDNMTLAQARQVVADRYGHYDMRIESEKAVKMLLDCADEKINDGWVPVTKRLPEESTAVLVWCPERKNIYCAYYEEKCWWIFGAYFEKVAFKVIAWMPLRMPLPKLYKAESEGKE